jgi:hypothetical protein
MTKRFRDQGGAASMDPGPLTRWLTSAVMTHLSAPARVDKRHAAAEKQRIKHGAPHRVECFYQVDDGYSHLAAQALQRLGERYDIELECLLVEGPQGKNVTQPGLLLQLSRYDAFHVAPEYGLEFPEHTEAPDPALVQLASEILAVQEASGSFAAPDRE